MSSILRKKYNSTFLISAVITVFFIFLCVAVLPVHVYAQVGSNATFVPNIPTEGDEAIAFDGTNMWVPGEHNGDIIKFAPNGTYTRYTNIDASSSPVLSAIAFDGTNMWVTDYQNSLVIKVSPTGTVLGTYSVGSNPNGIAFDGTNMWTANADNSVSKVSPTGTVTTYSGTGAGPTGIAFDGTNMWTANISDGSVSEISPTGTIDTYSILPGAAFVAIAFDGTNMWVADAQNSNVIEISPTGSVLGTYSGNGLNQPYGIAFDGTNMWVTNNGSHVNGSLSEISPTGTITTYPGTTNPNGQLEYPYAIAFASSTDTMWATDNLFRVSVTMMDLNPYGNDSALSNFSINHGTLNPTFSTSTLSYTATTTYAITSVALTPTVDAPAGATIKGNGNPVSSGSPFTVSGLSVGDNSIDTIVLAPDKYWTSDYNLAFTRENSPDSTLSNLTIDQGTLTPTFNTNNFDYTATTTSNITSVNVTPTLTTPGGTITINGSPATSGSPFAVNNLAVGANNITINVTGADSSTSTYQIVLTRAAAASYHTYPGSGIGPDALAFDGTNMWTANIQGNSVSEFSPMGTVLGTYSLANNTNPGGIAFDGTNMWTANAGNDSVSKISPTGTVTSYSLPSGASPYSIAFDGTNMWTGNYGNDSVSKISPTGTVTSYSLPSGSSPNGIAFDGTNMWTANNGNDTVSEIAPNGTVIGTHSVESGSEPYAIAFDGTNMWTANNGNDTVSEIAPNGTLVGTYSVESGSQPEAIAFDGTNMWTANYGNDSVSKIAHNGTLLNTYSLPLGSEPDADAFDGTNMWAADFGTNSVTEFTLNGGGGASTTYSITVTQGSNGTISPGTISGIASGTSETFSITPASGFQINTLTVDGSSVATTTSYTFPSVNANHTITASFSAIPAGGVSLSISPSTLPAATVNSSYSQVFTASGVATGTFTWSISSGSLPSGITLNTSSTGSSTTISGTPTGSGTFTFTVQVVNGSSSGTQSLSLTVNATSGGGNGGGGGGGGTSPVVEVASGGTPIVPSAPAPSVLSSSVSSTIPIVIIATSTPTSTASVETILTTVTTSTPVIPPLPPVPPLPTSTAPTYGFIFVVDNVVNGYGGAKTSSNFSISVTGTSVSPSSFAGNASGTLVRVKPGKYSISQKAVTGYSVALSSGCSGTAVIHQSSVCSIMTTQLVPPQLTVIQKVINSYFGTSTAQNFTVAVKGTSVSSSSFSGNAAGTLISLAPGIYSVSEKSISGYTITLSSGCSGTVTYGSAPICTITASDPAISKLIVNEFVLNNYGGTKISSSFTISVKGTSVSPSSFAGNASGTIVTLKPGTYSVSQKAVTGYATTLSSGCAGGVLAGEVIQCNVVSSDLPAPQLTVIQKVINSYFGTSTAQNFTVAVKGTSVSSSSFSGNAAGTLISLAPGIYSVSEKSISGYTITLSSGCSGTVTYGSAPICTITASDPAISKLIVTETVLNTSSGIKTPSNFTIKITGTSVSPSSFAGNASGTIVTLKPGTYSIVQNSVSKYSYVLGSGCSSIAIAGKTETCAITTTQAGYVAPVVSVPPMSATSTTPITSTSTTGIGGGSGSVQTSTPTSTIGTSSSGTIPVVPVATSTPPVVASSSPTSTTPSTPTSSLSISINNGSVVVTSTDVTITLSPSPLPPGTIDTSNEGTESSSSVIAVPAGPYPWTLTPGQGIKTVTVGYTPSGSSVSTMTATRNVFLDDGESILTSPMLDCSSVYLTGYAFANRPTNSVTVIKIQQFLNKYLGMDLVVNGLYDAATQAAVDKFQLQYSSEVLAPWIPYGLPNQQTPTSNTYKTTQRWINILACPGLNLPIPQLP